MKEAFVSAGPNVSIKDSPIPKAGKDELVIKVAVSGSNPKDWKYPEWDNTSDNQGDDIAGTVHEVGPGAEVYGFKVGDRVAAFHTMLTPHGSYAEYAIAPVHTAINLPSSTTYEEAATLPLAVYTAVVGLYADNRLALPEPWAPATEPTPLVIYGGATSVGAFAIKYAQRSNIHPIITVAGKGTEFVEGLLDKSKGDVVVDYRQGHEGVVKEIKAALNGKPLKYAFDCVGEHGSSDILGEVLAEDGRLTFVLPLKDDAKVAKSVYRKLTYVANVHTTHKDLGLVHARYLTKGLHEGWFKGHPFEVVKGGLEGVEGALKNLKDGKASAVKYVFRIADTPGV